MWAAPVRCSKEEHRFLQQADPTRINEGLQKIRHRGIQVPNAGDESAKIPYTLDEPKIVANEGDGLGRFDLTAELGKFGAEPPRNQLIPLIYMEKFGTCHRLDIAGVASSVGHAQH
ncbi:hypothetical protein [Sphingobium sp. Cam5-1]|uniref:hypothetical protein n=1 Tax=Sphingobium sp. Cam5-1 TaxID=2789327 RepID=UPI001E4646D6|nr:hypothetical protein [Sphingobium sp. Cam5-1]